MHDEHQHPLQAVEDCEDVGHGQRFFVKLKAAEDPHGAQYTQLSNGSDSECPVGGDGDQDLYTAHAQTLLKWDNLKMRECNYMGRDAEIHTCTCRHFKNFISVLFFFFFSIFTIEPRLRKKLLLDFSQVA